MNNFKFTQDYVIYSPKKQGVYPVQEMDWNRLKNMIQNIIPERKIYNILYSLFFGIFISSLFSIISLSPLNNLPTWLLPTNFSICISSLVIGISLVIIDMQQKKIIRFNSRYIIDEMKKIEEQFEKDKINESNYDDKKEA